MEIWVKENQLTIKDWNNLCVMENSYQFEEDINDWVIVVGSEDQRYGFSIQVL